VSIARLVIVPRDKDYAPENHQAIVRALAELEFIGGSYPGNQGERRFLIGERFLNYLTFLGCSPAIEIAPPADDGEDFCHVVISPIHEQVQFCADAAGKGPRCPHCRYEERDWQSLARQYQAQAQQEYVCPRCQQMTPITELNWHKSAVMARVFISIFSVFPNEAVLADKVLQQLEQATGTGWRYFYSR
jgi:hypothetical protein